MTDLSFALGGLGAAARGFVTGAQAAESQQLDRRRVAQGDELLKLRFRELDETVKARTNQSLNSILEQGQKTADEIIKAVVDATKLGRLTPKVELQSRTMLEQIDAFNAGITGRLGDEASGLFPVTNIQRLESALLGAATPEEAAQTEAQSRLAQASALEAGGISRERAEATAGISAPEGFSSPIGQFLEDRRRAVETFGADSFEVQTIDAAIEAEGDDSPDLSDQLGIFREFSRQSKGFSDAATAFLKVRDAAQDATGASDQALIFNFIKTLDPGSTVREGEFAQAEQVGGEARRWLNTYNRIVSGERLDEKSRRDILSTAAGQLIAEATSQRERQKIFTEFALANRVDPTTVVKPLGVQAIAEAERIRREAQARAEAGQTQTRAVLPEADQRILAKPLDDITPEEVERLSPAGQAEIRRRALEAEAAARGAR